MYQLTLTDIASRLWRGQDRQVGSRARVRRLKMIG
jgi:hypothetical protein